PFRLVLLLFFFFNDTSPTPLSPLSLHDALPISPRPPRPLRFQKWSIFVIVGQPEVAGFRLRLVVQLKIEIVGRPTIDVEPEPEPDRKSTRLNSSHRTISYAVFCLKKKKKIKK